MRNTKRKDKQHFEAIEYFGGEETFKKIVQRDEIKDKYCDDNNINLIRISYKEKIKDKLIECGL